MTRARIMLAALAVLVLAASDAQAEDMTLSKSPNAFAVDLFQELRAKEGNLFFSPYSVHVALSMVRDGAKGKTRGEMDEVLHLSGESVAGMYRSLAGLLEPKMVREGYGARAKQVPAYEFAAANRVWVQSGLSLVPSYVQVLKSGYGAPLERIDFGNPAKARERINAWVAERTLDRILDIIPEGLPSRECLLALANALHFKAAWSRPFDRIATKSRAFYPTGKFKMAVPTMHTVQSLPYAETEELQALEIPYRGSYTSMVVLLPKGWDPGAFEESLDAEKVSGILGALRRQRVSVYLPKFKITCPLDLTEILPEMGMKLAFTPEADFTGITKEAPLLIGAVLHKAFVAVDEAGTEAAAATVVLMDRGGPPPGKPVEFKADRPFLFLIRHRATGTILFMGRLFNPNEG